MRQPFLAGMLLAGMLLAGLLLAASSLPAQQALWRAVQRNDVDAGPEVVTLSPAHRAALRHLLTREKVWFCEPSDMNAGWFHDLTIERLRVSRQPVYLVEAGAGCARGGQGSNGAMWLVRFEGDRAIELASDATGFSGWVYGLGPGSRHGMRDVIVGWHMSASQSALAYFRFDGRVYRTISAATMTGDEDGNDVIVANAPPKPSATGGIR